MDHATRVEAVRRETELLAVAAEAAGPEAPVPSCPGWDVAELLGQRLTHVEDAAQPPRRHRDVAAVARQPHLR